MNLQLHRSGIVFLAGLPDAKYSALCFMEVNCWIACAKEPESSRLPRSCFVLLEGTIGWDVSYEFEFEAAHSRTIACSRKPTTKW